MIEFASDKYREEIIKLWQEAFGDDENFINSFLDYMNYKETMLVYVENDEVFGMATMLPVFCKEHKGRYIYAVATAKEQRGKGICRKIMQAVDDFIVNENEKFAVLVPSEESLFGFYDKMGYKQVVLRPDFPKVEETGKQCSASEYFEIRERIFENYNLISWSEKKLEYILKLGRAELCRNGAVYSEDSEVKEALVPQIFEKEWTIPFAEIKYYDNNLKFEKPYFGLCMN